MVKKWLITLVLILLACTAAFLIYNTYNSPKPSPAAETFTQKNRGAGRSVPADVTPEKQAIIKAVIAKMTLVMESKNPKTIREFLMSLAPDADSKEVIKNTQDSQILKSAQFYKDLNLGNSIGIALAYLPDSAWNISATTATITQTTEDGHKTLFTATKVNGNWQ